MRLGYLNQYVEIGGILVSPNPDDYDESLQTEIKMLNFVAPKLEMFSYNSCWNNKHLSDVHKSADAMSYMISYCPSGRFNAP